MNIEQQGYRDGMKASLIKSANLSNMATLGATGLGVAGGAALGMGAVPIGLGLAGYGAGRLAGKAFVPASDPEGTYREGKDLERRRKNYGLMGGIAGAGAGSWLLINALSKLKGDSSLTSSSEP